MTMISVGLISCVRVVCHQSLTELFALTDVQPSKQSNVYITLTLCCTYVILTSFVDSDQRCYNVTL